MTTKQDNMNRNPTGKGGFGERPEDINHEGRPKNSLKSYIARKLAEMSDEQKEAWLKEHGIDGKFQWQMGEGNPTNTNEIGGKDGEPLPVLVEFINGKTEDNKDTG